MEQASGTQAERSAGAIPAATLETRDAVAIIVGLIIGSGIFTVPSLVAASVDSPALVLGLWLAGGVLSIVGGLCYAELATSYPDAGGDYTFVRRMYGNNLAFLYAWARMAIITSGSLAFVAFVFGDYMTDVAPLGVHSSTWYATLCILLLTLHNLAGIRQGIGAQNFLTVLEVMGLVAIIAAGIFLTEPSPSAVDAATDAGGPASPAGVVMVLILFAYGGWNEAAYVSAELRRPRSIASAIVISLGLVTMLYLLVNAAFLRGLSLHGMAESRTIASDLLERSFGDAGRVAISMLIALSALTSANATVIVGARSNFALGRDFAVFGRLGRWDRDRGTPAVGLIVQGLVSLALVALGTATRQGLQTMIDYTAPVFWFFILLVAGGVIVMRVREPALQRPFAVPFYPFTPLVFCATCAYLLYSSLSHAKTGAIVGIGVVVLGLAPLAWGHRRGGVALLCTLSGLLIISVALRLAG